MLYVHRGPLETLEDLRVALANAIELEFATIPAYLTALYSIKDGTNVTIAATLRTIILQEMLHLALVANILNAVDGRPDFPGSVPTYPGPLPMGIGTEPGGDPFIVPLKKLSLETVRDVFMVIEAPETPMEFPQKQYVLVMEDEYETIGDFYRDISQLIGDLGQPIFTGDPNRQVRGWFGPDLLFAVEGVATAQKAIEIIVMQGEGTPTTPAGGPAGLAHYYRFEEISRGQTLNQDLDVPPYYTWGDPAIVIDESGIWPVVDNAPDVPLPDDSSVATFSRQCDRTFSALIDALQTTFDGNPKHLDATIGLMYALRLQAQELVAMPIPDMENVNAGPRFLYDATTASG